MFLPVTQEELGGRADIIYVIGEAYVDHPSFGHAIVSRLIESEGLKMTAAWTYIVLHSNGFFPTCQWL